MGYTVQLVVQLPCPLQFQGHPTTKYSTQYTLRYSWSYSSRVRYSSQDILQQSTVYSTQYTVQYSWLYSSRVRYSSRDILQQSTVYSTQYSTVGCTAPVCPLQLPGHPATK